MSARTVRSPRLSTTANLSTCQHCHLRIEHVSIPRCHSRQPLNTWIHSGTSNVWCQNELCDSGLKAQFAEPS